MSKLKSQAGSKPKNQALSILVDNVYESVVSLQDYENLYDVSCDIEKIKRLAYISQNQTLIESAEGLSHSVKSQKKGQAIDYLKQLKQTLR